MGTMNSLCKTSRNEFHINALRIRLIVLMQVVATIYSTADRKAFALTVNTRFHRHLIDLEYSRVEINTKMIVNYVHLCICKTASQIFMQTL